ncbi:FAD-dependent oxidoreductase [Bacillus sp. JJ664]
MNIKSGLLYWPTTFPHSHAEYRPLEENIECDYVIVGSGVSGAQSAYFLSKTGASVVLVDKRKIAHGSTIVNTGLIQYINDKPLTACIDSFGKEVGVRFYRLCLEAVKGIEEITKNLEIDANFIRRKSLYFASDQTGKEMIESEYKVLVENGFPVEKFSKEDIKNKYQIEKESALFTSNDAELSPFKYVHGILQYVIKRDVRVFSETEVKSLIGTKNGVELFTDRHVTIKAKKVIFAGGYESLELKKDKNAVLSSTYAIVTEACLKNEAWHENSLIWETARPYLYFRTTTDGRIIVGGKDEYTINPEQRDAMLHHKKDQLLKSLIELYPKYKDVKIEYYWTGLFGSTHTGLPMIREYPEYPNCYFLMGFGGSGMIYSYILAKIIYDLITSGYNPDAHIFMN